MNTPVKSETLSKTLISQETHQSMFEDYLRTRGVQVASVFLEGSQVVPCQFEPTDETLPFDGAIESAFKTSIQQHQNKLLVSKAGRPQSPALRIAVLFSGGPAAGGHNVVAGLKSVLGDDSTLYGVKAGPKGLLEGDLFELTTDHVKQAFNTGGFDLLGSDRTKIKTDEQFAQVIDVVSRFNLNGIVIIGGDDSNTNAAILAEQLMDLNCQVIGVPKTIDGDLQAGSLLPISFGFDTATKIYAELVGNILQDTPSSRKYWHFIKLMGRSASHVALEVGLQTKASLCLVSEEVAERKMKLSEIINDIVEVILKRAEKGLNYGVCLIPEGLIEFVPELNTLIGQINDVFPQLSNTSDLNQRKATLSTLLSSELNTLFDSLPSIISDQLVSDRDSHGNLKVSQIPTEELIILMVKEALAARSEKPPGFAFNALNHFFGYEGRCGAPTAFDADYTFNLGAAAGSLLLNQQTGYIASLSLRDGQWVPIGIPLTSLIVTEQRTGSAVHVIEKALVEMDSQAFTFFKGRRDHWGGADCFSSPGPRQYEGAISNQLPISVALNQQLESLTYQIGERVHPFI